SVETFDSDAPGEPAAELVTRYLGVDCGHGERRQAMLARQITDDVDVLIHPAVGARVGCRTHDHRHAETARRHEHQLEVMSLPLLGAAVLVSAERLRPDIATARVCHDGIRALRHAEIEAPPLDRREPEMSRRRQDAHAYGFSAR